MLLLLEDLFHDFDTFCHFKNVKGPPDLLLHGTVVLTLDRFRIPGNTTPGLGPSELNSWQVNFGIQPLLYNTSGARLSGNRSLYTWNHALVSTLEIVFLARDG